MKTKTPKQIAERLTPRQAHVVRVLAVTSNPPAASDWGAWYPLHTTQVYGIVNALARKGLVDAAGASESHGRLSRTYKLTDEGWAVADVLEPDEELDENAL